MTGFRSEERGHLRSKWEKMLSDSASQSLVLINFFPLGSVTSWI